MKTIPNFLPLGEYAKLCGVENRAIYNRIKNKTLAILHIHGVDLIDTIQSPPTKRGDYRNRSNLRTPSLPDDVDVKNLFWVNHFAAEHSIALNALYERIFLGYYKGVIIGGKLFVDATSVVL